MKSFWNNIELTRQLLYTLPGFKFAEGENLANQFAGRVKWFVELFDVHIANY